ncbi:MAG: hypothetical protein WD715_00155 [Dongiaceae bacterium]
MVYFHPFAMAMLIGLAPLAAAFAGGADSVETAPPEPSPPVVTEANTAGPSDGEADEDCGCGARSPGHLARTQQQMQEWQAEQTP